MLNICQALNWARKELRKAKIKSAGLEADIFLSVILKKDKTFLYTNPHKKISTAQLIKLKQCLERRLDGEPLAYILGYKEFYGLKFLLNKDVLIPRPETELIVDEILRVAQDDYPQKYILIDIGTGSGCVPISILKTQTAECKKKNKIECYAIDISDKVLMIARKNAKVHGLEKKIKFIKSNLLSYFLNSSFIIHNSVLIITANLPYLSKKIYRENYQNLKFEPRNALLAGPDGLKYYRKLLKQIGIISKIQSRVLGTISKTKNISIFLEINPEQKNKIKKTIFKYLPKSKIEFKKDLSGRYRLVVLQLN